MFKLASRVSKLFVPRQIQFRRMQLPPIFSFNNVSNPETQLRILEIHDMHNVDHDVLITALSFANTTDLIVEMMKLNLGKMTDYQLAAAISQIQTHNLDLTESFHNFLVPMFKDYLKIMNRDHSPQLAVIIHSLGFLNVADPELWDLVEKKLMKENIVRYLPLSNLCEVALALSHIHKGSQDLYNEMEKHILNQRGKLNETQAKALINAFKEAKFGSQTFFKALEDKAADIEKLREEERILKIRKIAYA